MKIRIMLSIILVVSALFVFTPAGQTDSLVPHTYGTVSQNFFDGANVSESGRIPCNSQTRVEFVFWEIWQHATGYVTGTLEAIPSLGSQPLWLDRDDIPEKFVRSKHRIEDYYQWMPFPGTYWFESRIHDSSGKPVQVTVCYLNKI